MIIQPSASYEAFMTHFCIFIQISPHFPFRYQKLFCTHGTHGPPKQNHKILLPP